MLGNFDTTIGKICISRPLGTTLEKATPRNLGVPPVTRNRKTPNDQKTQENAGKHQKSTGKHYKKLFF